MMKLLKIPTLSVALLLLFYCFGNHIGVAQSTSFKVNKVLELFDIGDMLNRHSLSFEAANANKLAVKKALAAKESTSNPEEKKKLNWEIYRRGYQSLLTYDEKKFIVEEVSKFRYDRLSDEEKKYYDNAN